MTVHIYRSDDAGAPVWSGVAGTRRAVLRACLVDGYGTKAPAGWAEPFTSGNVSVFRPASGVRRFTQIDDGVAQYVKIRQFSDMTDATTGSNPCPSAGQLADGNILCAASAAGATARPWIVIADERAALVWVGFSSTAITSPGATDCAFFGDGIARNPSDVHFSCVLGGRASQSASQGEAELFRLATSATARPTHYIAGDTAGLFVSTPCTALATLPGSTSACGAAGPAFPDLGAMNLARIPLAESGFSVRGWLPGIFNVLHNQPGSHLDTVTLPNGETGLLLYLNIGTAGRICVQITGDWRA